MAPTGEELYEILGLEPGASRDQIERAYRFSLEMYREDALATYSLLEPTEVEALRSRVEEAYAVLGDPERRRAYDEGRGFAPPEASSEPLVSSAADGAEPAEIPDVLSGADLRRIREARGVTLRHVASVTKIGVRFLEYIEEDRFALLPAPVYLKGFLKEYARTLGIDPGRAAAAYMSRFPGRP
jgi:curved DNA-binding protein CbpA